MDIPPVLIKGNSVAFVDKKMASAYIGSSTLIERMLWATRHTKDPWLKLACTRNGSPKAKVLISTASLMVAARRMINGEEPPDIRPI